jgi:hypothetical protein
MINRKFSRYYQKTLDRASGRYDCGSAALKSSSVTSTRRARIYGIGVDQKYQPEAQASAYPDHSMIVFML